MKTTTNQINSQASGQIGPKEKAISWYSITRKNFPRFSLLAVVPILLVSCNEDSSEGKYEKMGKTLDKIETVRAKIDGMGK